MRRQEHWYKLSSPQIRTYVLSTAFLVVLVIGFVGSTASAAPLGGTVPPTPDIHEYDLFLPQAVAVSEDTDTDDNGGNGEVPVSTPTCPTTSSAQYASLSVIGASADRPPELHADLNLSVRSYVTVTMPLDLVNINGDTDGDAPQLANVVGDGKRPFVAAFQVNDWDWACTGDEDQPWYGHGCRGTPISYPPVTLIALETVEGEPIRVPSRQQQIDSGGHKALVLYAADQRITLVFTREDTAAVGYVLHIEDICVDPSLLALYQELDAAGRHYLPALHSWEQLGTGYVRPAKLAIRDSGSFMDPRSRKDWWREY